MRSPTAPIVVKTIGLPDFVLLEVHNRGAPIPDSLLPVLFQPFRGGDPTDPSRRQQGLGLGLYLVNEIVRAHGAEVAVRSTAPDGTLFSVKWPREASTG